VGCSHQTEHRPSGQETGVLDGLTDSFIYSP
jgi:hypothetical protein